MYPLRYFAIAPIGLIFTIVLFWFISELIETKPSHAPSKSEVLRLDFLRQVTKQTEQDIDPYEEEVIKQIEPEEPFSPEMALSLPELNHQLEGFDVPSTSLEVPISTPTATQGLEIGNLNVDANEGSMTTSNNRELMAVRENTLSYPSSARRKRIEGWVTFNYLVDESGSVSNVDIIESSPPRIFDRVVIKEVSQWKYLPRIENGKTVATKVVERKYVFSL